MLDNQGKSPTVSQDKLARGCRERKMRGGARRGIGRREEREKREKSERVRKILPPLAFFS